jgi:hypothetical protein
LHCRDGGCPKSTIVPAAAVSETVCPAQLTKQRPAQLTKPPRDRFTQVGENPCLPMYSAFSRVAKVGGFSQWCSGCNHSTDPHYVYNDWLSDGTPVFLQPQAMW